MSTDPRSRWGAAAPGGARDGAAEGDGAPQSFWDRVREIFNAARSAGALASADRGLEMLLAIAAADPKNVEAQHDLAFAHGERARARYPASRCSQAT